MKIDFIKKLTTIKFFLGRKIESKEKSAKRVEKNSILV